MSENETLDGGYQRRQKIAPEPIPDFSGAQDTDPGAEFEPGSVAEVASDLQSTFGNQIVSIALTGQDADGLGGIVATQLGAAVGGIGAWAQQEAGSNHTMCQAMRRAADGEPGLEAPWNLGNDASPVEDFDPGLVVTDD